MRLHASAVSAGGLAAPLVAGVAVLVVLPALGTLVLALLSYDALGAPQFAGLANLRQLWRDPMFWLACKNSLIVAALAVPARVALALVLALWLQHPRPGHSLARSAVYLPTVVPDIAWALLWLWLLNPLYGPLSLLLHPFGVPGAWWVQSPGGARFAIALTTLLAVGEMVVVMLAARREIPAEVYELCATEGASRFTVFRRVTLPLLWPALLFLSCRDAALTLQTTFVPALVITHGGPLFATTLLPLYVYQNGFEYLRFGYAAALTLGMFALTLAMVGVQLWLLRGWVRRGA